MDGVVVRMSELPTVILMNEDGTLWSLDEEYSEAMPVEFIRRDVAKQMFAQAPAPVRVRKLEWLDFPDRGAKAQAWNEANYMIQKWSDGRWEISASYPGYSTFIEGTDRFYPTLEAAKSAAQADYEARILAALEPDAGVVAELVDALRKFEAHYPRGINPFLDEAHSKARATLAKLETRA